MNKKRAVLITVMAMAVIYLFLLVGIPALENMVPPYGGYEETAATILSPEATANWTAGPSFPTRTYNFDPRPYREKTPRVMYALPGLIGIVAIVLILKQKKEVK